MSRSVYFFGNGSAEGSRDMKPILGSKGANLAEMTTLGIRVPAGFTIAADVCMEYLRTGSIPESLRGEVTAAITRLEQSTGKGFGAPANPLLVSVRSGAAISMPGMMETVLNLGLNDETVLGLATSSNSPRFAYDSYRRFVQMYGDVVLGVPAAKFESRLTQYRTAAGVAHDSDLPLPVIQELLADFRQLIRAERGHDFPTAPIDQLWGAIVAVWKSWNLKKAVDYRKVNRIADSLGTGVTIMAMVFGNTGEDSGTGVAFTRDPSTGERRLYGEFLINAQGEDVVAGIRTPMRIEEMATAFPSAYVDLQGIQERLERHYRDMQDLEFTIEHGALFLLQTRTGKRTTVASLRIAIDMVDEGLLQREEALQRVPSDALDQLLHRVIRETDHAELLVTGLPASPGAASGRIVFTPEEAEAWQAKGESVILVRNETTPDDFHGIVASAAVLTARGGMTSHAAVVARGMGKCAIVGCTALEIAADEQSLRIGERTFAPGDWITLDGATGRVFAGQVPLAASDIMQVIHGTRPENETPTFQRYIKLMQWADGVKRLKIRANADTPQDAQLARRFGAEGIGLCRTEHMFFSGDRLRVMREMIVARDLETRRQALERLLPMQREDFNGIFHAMDGYPVTIRLLDPPLHEFLPHEGDELTALAETLKLSPQALLQLVEGLREANPMLGHRGCRLGIVFPEITEMQVRAIFESALQCHKRGINVHPEIMVPLVSDVTEFRHQRTLIDQVAMHIMQAAGETIPYHVGTMIELPRAALTADAIAREADFFSFGTNDLTQTTFGMSRDDSGRFLPFYLTHGILPDDPFQTLDVRGVGQLMEWAIRSGRSARPQLALGICGEHGGDSRSVGFCHDAGLDYVSCSPYRIPVARLAAAQAALRERPTIKHPSDALPSS